MDKLYVVQDKHGYGKDRTVELASRQYERYNGKLKKPYSILTFDALNPEDVVMSEDGLTYRTLRYARFIGSEIIK